MGLSGSRSATCSMQHAACNMQHTALSCCNLRQMQVKCYHAWRMPHAACHNWPLSLPWHCRRGNNAATTLLNLHNFRSAFSRFSALLRCCSALSFAPPSYPLIIKLATETFTKHLAKNAHLPETCADCVMRRRNATGQGRAEGGGSRRRAQQEEVEHTALPSPRVCPCSRPRPRPRPRHRR